MIRENSREEITVSDGLQLGKSSMDQNEIRTVEDEVDTLKQQVSEVCEQQNGTNFSFVAPSSEELQARYKILSKRLTIIIIYNVL